VPEGPNIANNLAVDIDKSAVALGATILFASMGQYGKVNHAWTKTVDALDKTQVVCGNSS
jgi:hypothetical protein